MFNFHEGRVWLLCQDKWNLLLATTEVEMKIIIKKYKEGFDRMSVTIALGNSGRKKGLLKNLQENENIKGHFDWHHNLIYF